MVQNIIDTHIHIWDLKRVRYAWLEGDTSILNRTYLVEELIPQMKLSPVTGGVLVQAANNPEDTALMLEAARSHPEIKGVVGWLPLTDPDKTAELLENQFQKEPLLKGVRHLIHNESNPQWLLQDTVLESLRLLASKDIPYDIVGVKDEHLKTAIRVSEAIPTLRLVLDHLNQPPIANRIKFGLWGDLIKEISGNENVYAKISGLGTASGNPGGWTAEDISPYIAFVFSCFGVNRCFCGGDWPVSTLAGSYISQWEKYTQSINSLLQEEDTHKVYYENAGRFYNLTT